jgi:nitrogen regulatory protein P-II 1
MKLVVATIQSSAYEAVQAALDGISVSVISLSRVNGPATSPGVYRGAAFLTGLPKLRIELACEDASVETVVRQIVRHGFTSDSATPIDDKVFVTSLDAYVAADEERTRTASEDEWHEHLTNEYEYADQRH